MRNPGARPTAYHQIGDQILREQVRPVQQDVEPQPSMKSGTNLMDFHEQSVNQFRSIPENQHNSGTDGYFMDQTAHILENYGFYEAEQLPLKDLKTLMFGPHARETNPEAEAIYNSMTPEQRAGIMEDTMNDPFGAIDEIILAGGKKKDTGPSAKQMLDAQNR